MDAQWNTLAGSGHQFLKTAYTSLIFLLDKIIQPKTIYDLNKKVDLSAINLGEQWQTIAQHYRGFLGFGAVAVVLLQVLLFAGPIFCCCLCCHSTKKRDTQPQRHKPVCSLCLFSLATTAMFTGTLIMFVSNSLLNATIQSDKVYWSVKTPVRGIETFINTTVTEASGFILDLYSNAQRTVEHLMESAPEDAISFIGARGVLEDLVNLVGDIHRRTTGLDQGLNDLQALASLIDFKLGRLKFNISNLLVGCSSNVTCASVLDGLAISVDFTTPDSFRDVISALNQTINMSAQADDQLAHVADTIRESINSSSVTLSEALDEGYTQLFSFLDDLSSMSDLDLVGKVDDYISQDMRTSMDSYTSIWFYVMLGITGFLLLIVLLTIIAGTCILVGHPKQKYKAGSLLMCTVCPLVYINHLLVIISIVLSLGGGLLHTEFCRYFGSPVRYNNSLTTINELLSDKLEFDVPIMKAVQDCGNGASLYTTLEVDRWSDLDLDSTLDLDNYGLTSSVNQLSSISLDIGTITLLSADALQTLHDLNQTLNNINFTSFYHQTMGNLTGAPLLEAVAVFNQFASLPSATIDPDEFDQCHDQLLAIQNVDIAEINAKRDTVIAEIAFLESIVQAKCLDTRVAAIGDTEQTIDEQGDAALRPFLGNLSSFALEVMTNMSASTKHYIRYEAGRCAPLKAEIYKLLSFACVHVLYPLNAFWFGMGLFLAFSIAALPVTCKLVNVFRNRAEVGPGPERVEQYREVLRRDSLARVNMNF